MFPWEEMILRKGFKQSVIHEYSVSSSDLAYSFARQPDINKKLAISTLDIK